MPGMGQIFPYVLPDAGRNRRWCLRGIQITLLVRLAARMSSRSLTSLRPAVILPFFMRGGAPLAHGPLLANSIAGNPPNPQGAINRAPTHSALLRSPFMDNSPTTSKLTANTVDNHRFR